MRLSIGYFPIIRKMATLPNECIKIVESTPAISGTDKVVGNTIVTSKTGVFEVMYATARENLVNDNDEPDLHISAHHNLANFACYKYWLNRKKIEVAEAFLNKYMIERSNLDITLKDMSCTNDYVTIEY